MFSLIDLIFGIAITCLLLAFVTSIADGIWDRIEDDVAKDIDYDKIEK